ncbi:cation transporter [Oenococcus sicerae]|uniref:Cation transporter n=1 Tax=Oenococcus sicerae TaxID=2203724 RepID=A0AAJ1VMS4_9LACO|nr:cation diffusion facilitator family transporter [Oenococcus sicerae]MDN6899991.1 cation transporter [Oenococcus sicerae]QAS69606.1 cation transporter [Oenococcus sicerae]
MDEENIAQDPRNRKKYWLGISINLIFIIFEVACGLFASSLALVTDAVHNLGDVLGLVISLVAVILLKRKPTKHHTYGFYNTTILAAFINSLILVASLTLIIWESILRLLHPESHVNGGIVAVVALIGVVINGLTAYIFQSGAHGELNERANYWHFVGDALISLCVVIAGVAINFTGWEMIDPLVSILAAVFILRESWNVFISSFDLVTNGVPDGVDEIEVEKYLLSLPEIDKINDMHIWALSTTEIAISAHLQCDQPGDYMKIIDSATEGLRKNFHIDHVTLQLETCNKKHKESTI